MEKGTSLEVIHRMNEMHRVLCECLLNDTDFLDDLRDFDLIVHDSVAACPVLVAELLKVQRVEIEPVSPNAPFLFYHMVPMPVSYVPQSFPGYSDKMTFLQRVINLGAYIFASRIFMASLADTMNGVKYKYNIKPERSLQKAIGDAELLIINADFALEYPQPLLPVAGTKTSFASPNIKIVDWLPQNDLLGHKDIKAFVSHVGQNSLYESVYHGVPVVAFPLFVDQFFNARKVEHFGLGLFDVAVFLVAVVTLVVMVIRMTCQCLCHLCSKRSGTKSKEE